MNKIYRLVWSASQRAWMVACEFAKADGKAGSSRMLKIVGRTGALMAAMVAVEPANAWVAETGTSSPALDGGVASNTSVNGGSATGSANASAIGPSSTASANGSTAVGYRATASGGSSVAAGRSVASGDGAIAVGDGATASADNSVAIGRSTQASSTYGVAIGYQAVASTGTGGIAIGDGAKSVDTGATALGYGAKANAANTTALGAGAVGTDQNSTALGVSALAEKGSLAAGYLSKATGQSSAAFGYDAKALGDYSMALGTNTKAAAADSVALGKSSVADIAAGVAGYDPITKAASTQAISAWKSGLGAVSVGDSANYKTRQITNLAAGALDTDAVNVAQLKNAVTAATTHYYSVNDNGTKGGNYNNDGATGINALAAGIGATATGQSGIAVGNTAKSTNNDTIAVGHNAVASSVNPAHTDMIAIGLNSNASNDHALALGSSAAATSNNTVAVGVSAAASGPAALALGHTATASGSYSTAVGSGATASKGSAVAIGYKSNAAGDNSAAIGYQSTTSATNTLAIGINANAQTAATNAIAIGNAAVASSGAVNSIALGSAATASVTGGVALGSGSLANTAAGIAGYDPLTKLASIDTSATWKSTLGAVSIGDAASGKTRQITGVAAGRADTDAVNIAQLKGATDAAVMYDNSTHNSVTLGGDTYDSTTKLGGTRIKNVAAGVDGGDAVNVDQLNDLADTPITFAGNTGSADKKLGDTFTIEGAGTTAGTYSGNNLKTAVDADGKLQLLMADNVVLDSVTTGNTTLDTNGLAITGGPSVTVNGIDAGNQKITNVADGDISAGSSDAINGSQLYATNQQVEQNTSDITVLQQDALQWNDALDAYDASHGTADPKKITNVANGLINSTSVDAINGSQLYSLAESTASAMGGGSVVNPDGSITAPTYNVGDVTVNNVGDAIIHIDARVTQNTSDITVLQQDALQWNDALGAYDASHGTADPQKITNVADGDIGAGSSDAINGSQLYATNQQVDQNTTDISNVTNNINNGTVGPVQRTGTDQLSLIAAGGAASAPGAAQVLTNVADGWISDTSTDAINGSQLHETNQQVDANTTNISNLDGRVTNIYETGTKYFHANSTGTDSVASGVDSVAIGMGAIASHDGSVALGAGSVADGSTLGNEAYLVGGTANGEVNVGHRRITGLSAGADDTDAVNVAQLKAITTASVADAVMYDNSTHNSITLGGDTYDSVTHTGGTTITNVANGVADSDAVNMSQLNETNENVTNLGDTITNIAGDTSVTYTDAHGVGIRYTRTNEAGLAQSDSSAEGQGSTAVGYNASSIGESSLALGREAQANHKDDVALGSGSVTAAAVATTGVTINGVDYAFAGIAPTSTVSVGSVGRERTISNLAAGRISATSTDAVNGSQLWATNQAITQLGSNITNVFDNGTKYFHAKSSKADSVASGDDSIAVGPNAKASGSGAVAMGNDAEAAGKGSLAMGEGATSTADGSVALGKGASDGGRGAETYVGKYSNVDNATVGTVSVGNAATGETRTISNVADAKEATDAVNLRQLDGAVAQANEYTDSSITEVNEAVTNLDGRVTNVDGRVSNIEGDVTHIKNGTDGMFQVNNTSNLPKPAPTGSDSVAGGAGAVASGNNAMAVGTKAEAAGENAVAMGNGSSARAKDSVALGANSVADRANTVSVGTAGAERQITHVAKGTADTDAVNVAQLNQSVGDITNNANNYTDQRYNALQRDLDEQDDTLSAGIAGAMAMASLPQPYVPGASMAAAGLGTYRGQGAVAVGVSRISDNGKWVTKLQGSTTTQGNFGAAVGVGYQW
ncbi:YadA-like family protein [Pseudomonas sp. UL073]|uniref:YadA-like family protein n=1 Tax=Zestomonas insulae TaxID=2809017 RepID=A0ABS2IFR3_9GAMM|nr:YadA-like family protein [Pseudomonas insulae]MBM7060772.1 YadA-like family protein [Pseudomonas insulae]